MVKYIKSNQSTKTIPYDMVSTLVILRDHANVGSDAYINQEHEDLVDIADTLYNAGLRVEDMLPKYQDLYNAYGKDYFDKVLKDCKALDSQINHNNVNDLIDDYIYKFEHFA